MATPTNKVKMTFFIIYDIFLLFQKLPIKNSIPHCMRTDIKLLLQVKPHILLIYEKFCVGPCMVRYLNNLLKFQNMIEKYRKSRFRLMNCRSHGNTRCIIRILSMFSSNMVIFFILWVKLLDIKEFHIFQNSEAKYWPYRPRSFSLH